MNRLYYYTPLTYISRQQAFNSGFGGVNLFRKLWSWALALLDFNLLKCTLRHDELNILQTSNVYREKKQTEKLTEVNKL